jgi:hypothetical protein
MMIVSAGILCALATSLGGLMLLWQGWRNRAAMGGRIAGALLLWAVSTALWIGSFGAEIGIPLALETAALVAFAFILSRIERRTEKPARMRTAPTIVHSRWWIALGIARALVASLLGLIAAMGFAVVIAVKAPMAEQTRLIIAGLIVPTLWAICIAWVVTRKSLPLQAATFALIGVLGFGFTLLTGA